MRWRTAPHPRRSSGILGSVSMPRPVPRQLAGVSGRWLLVGLVMAGIVGMHVLSAPDSGEGHGMVMTAQRTELGHTDGHGATSAAPMLMSDAAAGEAIGATSVAAAGGNGMSGSMAMCLLFLGAAAAALAVLMLRMRRKARPAGHSCPAASGWGPFLRGPPGADPPRIALCVLRV